MFFCSVTISSKAVQAFQDLKNIKNAKFIIFGLDDESGEIVVRNKSEDNSYATFLEGFPEDDCRFAVYDFGNGKIVLFNWFPDDASPENKVIYNNGKGNVQNALDGVTSTVECSEVNDLCNL